MDGRDKRTVERLLAWSGLAAGLAIVFYILAATAVVFAGRIDTLLQFLAAGAGISAVCTLGAALWVAATHDRRIFRP